MFTAAILSQRSMRSPQGPQYSLNATSKNCLHGGSQGHDSKGPNNLYNGGCGRGKKQDLKDSIQEKDEKLLVWKVKEVLAKKLKNIYNASIRIWAFSYCSTNLYYQFSQSLKYHMPNINSMG